MSDGPPADAQPTNALAHHSDLVLFGATGYAGRLVAEYLLEHGPSVLRFALAGRDLEKLEAVRSGLAERFPRARVVPLLVADAEDRSSLDRIVRQTRVVASTVGPYGKHGQSLVAACAAAGTHYCDVTGEVPFVRQMIDAHEEEAKASGARIVHACGFDSVPSDLGCLMLGEALLERGARPKRVRFFAGEQKGGVSGGTAATAIHLLESRAGDPKLRQLMQDPYALNPEDQRSGPDVADPAGVHFDRDLGMWTGPFVMSMVNTRIVRRSHALRGRPYGDGFRYAEAMSTGSGPGGFFRAVGLAASVGGLALGLQVGPFRRLVERRMLPKPGEGPKKETRDTGFFVCRLIGDGVTEDGQPVQIRGLIRGNKDPGYGETAKMLGESALSLAFDQLPVRGGSWTPASAMGSVLIGRLRKAGMTFEISE